MNETGRQAAPPDAERIPVLVWDPGVRSFHWLVVILVAFSWVTAEAGWIEAHRTSGYAILSLVAFRVYWGLRGSTTARFSHFVRGPKAVARYTRSFFSRSRYRPSIGHNPLAGWNVLALLVLLLLQGGLGLFAVDQYGTQGGPMSRYVDFETARRIAALHAATFRLLFLFIVLHVLAVLVHLVFKRENLIFPMLTGVMHVRPDDVPRLSFVAPWRAWLAIAISALLVLALVASV